MPLPHIAAGGAGVATAHCGALASKAAQLTVCTQYDQLAPPLAVTVMRQAVLTGADQPLV